MSRSALVVSLHDVSPHTLGACERIIAELAQLGVSRTSLLVVPDHHHRGHFLAYPTFREWLIETARSGHEAVIHGYFHQRERRAEETAIAKLTTRIYTADEGEFFDIDRTSALALVQKARGEFRELGLEPAGFIAPAWLLSTEGEQALRELGIKYTTRLGTVVDLQPGAVTRSQSLVWSVRAAWRRLTSLAWNATLFRRLRHRGLLRVSIHPVDIQHPAIWRQIKRLTQRALQTRECITYEQWITAADMMTTKP